MATASIFALLGRSRFQKGFKRVGPLAVADEDHGAAVQVQDDRQVAVPLGDGDLVNGDAPQVLEIGLGVAATKVALLDVLDHVPADTQVLEQRRGWSCAATAPGHTARRTWCSSAAGRRRGP